MSNAQQDDAQWLSAATHLVVFQHGLLGSEGDWHSFALRFQQYFPLDELYVHCARANATTFMSMFQTYDGIDAGGERLADEITALAARMPRLARFSIVGHSLGGLYARYCIGVLFSRGFLTPWSRWYLVVLCCDGCIGIETDCRCFVSSP
ncbi:hypothetical protein PINS_up022456 [Pythium insidiosum]|nr:hypothetical protein PINS_up022456 [Pythium insidiosum]